MGTRELATLEFHLHNKKVQCVLPLGSLYNNISPPLTRAQATFLPSGCRPRNHAVRLQSLSVYNGVDILVLLLIRRSGPKGKVFALSQIVNSKR